MVKQFDWPELMLTINTTRKIRLRPVSLCYPVLIGDHEHHFTDQHQVCPGLNSSIGPELMLHVKLFQFKICELAAADDA